MSWRTKTVVQVVTCGSALCALLAASCGGKALDTLDDVSAGRAGMSASRAGSAGASSGGASGALGGAPGVAGAPIPIGGFSSAGSMSTTGGAACQAEDACAPYRCAGDGCSTHCQENADCFAGFCQAERCHELAVGVAVGSLDSCALLAGGKVLCWGANDRGQLGHDGPPSTQPVEVPKVRAAGLALGERFACAPGNDGGVECWGFGTSGQLGNGASQTSSVPVGVVGLEAFAAQVVAGQAHACVLLTTGGVRCWGDNSRGQLGNGTRTGSPAPYPVSFLGDSSRVKQLVAGARHNCVLLDDGAVSCWGAGQLGELGLPDLVDGLQPRNVQGLPGMNNPVLGLSAGGDHTCALMTDGRVLCWGADAAGQLGDGVRQPYAYYPSPVLGLPVGGDAVAQFAAGVDGNCVLLGFTGRVRCLGNNPHGELGDGTQTSSLGLVRVLGIPTSQAGVGVLAVGPEHACVTWTDGSISCWGDNSAGELGSSTNAGFSAVPVLVQW